MWSAKVIFVVKKEDKGYINKMEPTNPNANTYVKPLCTKRDTAGQNLFFTL